MKKKTLLVAITLSILYGFAPRIYPEFISLINKDHIAFLKPITSYEESCNEKTSNAECTHRYVIPKSQLKHHSHLGIGKILTSIKYYCSDNPDRFYTRGNIANFNNGRFQLNVYNMINVSEISCSQNIVIEAWSPLGASRSGYQSGVIAVGNESTVNMLKVTFEFFKHDFLLFSILLLCLAIFIVRKFKLNDQFSSVFIRSNIFWIFYILLSSGFISIFVPIRHNYLIYSTILHIMSLISHLDILINFISYHEGKLNKEKIKLFLYLIISYCLILNSSYFFTLIPLILILGILAGIRYRNIVFITFLIAMFNSYFKYLGYNVIPSARLTTIFMTFAQLIWLIELLTKNSKVRRKMEDYLTLNNHSLSVVSRGIDMSTQELAHDIATPIDVLEYYQSSTEKDPKLLEGSIDKLKNLKKSILETNKESVINISNFLTNLKNEYKILYDMNISLEIQRELKVKMNEALFIKFSRAFSNVLKNALEEANSLEAENTELQVSLNEEEIDIIIVNKSRLISSKTLYMLNNGVSFSAKSDGHGIGSVFSFNVFKDDLQGSITYEFKKPNMITKIQFPVVLLQK